MAEAKRAPKATSQEKTEVKKSVELKVADKKIEKSTTIQAKGILNPLRAHGVGRRKKAVARVWLKRGKGDIVVNGKKLDMYFDTKVTAATAVMAFKAVSISIMYDAQVNVRGGGLWGQADAVKLGIARALVDVDSALKPELRKHGLLTVDARNKERKKYGQRGARRKFQFVKR